MNPKAIEYFKDWSNYLLVTTVAALGWVATKNLPFFSPWMRLSCMVALGLSVVFGIFTLALIPIIAEQQATNQSFYTVRAPFKLFGMNCTLPVKSVCFPQHVLFIIGIVLYVVGTGWQQS